MSRLPVLGLLCWLLRAADAGDAHKQVVYTPWWPPGTEKEAESVGIISNGFVYMTGMMESNETFPALAEAEMSDIRDIAHGAGAQLEDVVDCLINAPSGGAAGVRQAFEQAFAAHTKMLPALTIVEAPGEYFFFNVSTACIAFLPKAGAPKATVVQRDLAYGRAAHGLLHLRAKGAVNASEPGAATSAALASVDALVRDAGGSGLASLAECTVFVQELDAMPAVRRAFQAAAPSATPALAFLQAGLEDPRQHLAMRCVAGLPTEEDRTGAGIVHLPGGVTVANRMVYTSAQLSKLDNGTDAFMQLETNLRAAGAGLEDVVNCFFYVRRQENMFDFFAGFRQVFNIDHPPPPARDELSGKSECAECTVALRCVAALPLTVPLPAPASATLVV